MRVLVALTLLCVVACVAFAATAPNPVYYEASGNFESSTEQCQISAADNMMGGAACDLRVDWLFVNGTRADSSNPEYDATMTSIYMEAPSASEPAQVHGTARFITEPLPTELLDVTELQVDQLTAGKVWADNVDNSNFTASADATTQFDSSSAEIDTLVAANGIIDITANELFNATVLAADKLVVTGVADIATADPVTSLTVTGTATVESGTSETLSVVTHLDAEKLTTPTLGETTLGNGVWTFASLNSSTATLSTLDVASAMYTSIELTDTLTTDVELSASTAQITTADVEIADDIDRMNAQNMTVSVKVAIVTANVSDTLTVPAGAANSFVGETLTGDDAALLSASLVTAGVDSTTEIGDLNVDNTLTHFMNPLQDGVTDPRAVLSTTTMTSSTDLFELNYGATDVFTDAFQMGLTTANVDVDEKLLSESWSTIGLVSSGTTISVAGEVRATNFSDGDMTLSGELKADALSVVGKIVGDTMSVVGALNSTDATATSTIDAMETNTLSSPNVVFGTSVSASSFEDSSSSTLFDSLTYTSATAATITTLTSSDEGAVESAVITMSLVVTENTTVSATVSVSATTITFDGAVDTIATSSMRVQGDATTMNVTATSVEAGAAQFENVTSTDTLDIDWQLVVVDGSSTPSGEVTLTDSGRTANLTVLANVTGDVEFVGDLSPSAGVFVSQWSVTGDVTIDENGSTVGDATITDPTLTDHAPTSLLKVTDTLTLTATDESADIAALNIDGSASTIVSLNVTDNANVNVLELAVGASLVDSAGVASKLSSDTATLDLDLVLDATALAMIAMADVDTFTTGNLSSSVLATFVAGTSVSVTAPLSTYVGDASVSTDLDNSAGNITVAGSFVSTGTGANTITSNLTVTGQLNGTAGLTVSGGEAAFDLPRAAIFQVTSESGQFLAVEYDDSDPTLLDQFVGALSLGGSSGTKFTPTPVNMTRDAAVSTTDTQLRLTIGSGASSQSSGFPLAPTPLANDPNFAMESQPVDQGTRVVVQADTILRSDFDVQAPAGVSVHHVLEDASGATSATVDSTALFEVDAAATITLSATTAARALALSVVLDDAAGTVTVTAPDDDADEIDVSSGTDAEITVVDRFTVCRSPAADTTLSCGMTFAAPTPVASRAFSTGADDATTFGIVSGLGLRMSSIGSMLHLRYSSSEAYLRVFDFQNTPSPNSPGQVGPARSIGLTVGTIAHTDFPGSLTALAAAGSADSAIDLSDDIRFYFLKGIGLAPAMTSGTGALDAATIGHVIVRDSEMTTYADAAALTDRVGKVVTFYGYEHFAGQNTATSATGGNVITQFMFVKLGGESLLLNPLESLPMHAQEEVCLELLPGNTAFNTPPTPSTACDYAAAGGGGTPLTISAPSASDDAVQTLVLDSAVPSNLYQDIITTPDYTHTTIGLGGADSNPPTPTPEVSGYCAVSSASYGSSVTYNNENNNALDIIAMQLMYTCSEVEPGVFEPFNAAQIELAHGASRTDTGATGPTYCRWEVLSKSAVPIAGIETTC